MKKIQKAYAFICRAEQVMAGVFLVVVLIVIFAAAVGRSIGHPLGWGMDMATFLFAWAVFFSADVAMRKDRQVKVEVLIRKLPEKVQNFIALFNYFVILIFLAFLIGFGLWLSYYTRFRTFQGIPGFSYMWATLSVPVGSILMLITTTLKIRETLKRIRANSGK